jgi:hypothetical protein
MEDNVAKPYEKGSTTKVVLVLSKRCQRLSYSSASGHVRSCDHPRAQPGVTLATVDCSA